MPSKALLSPPPPSLPTINHLIQNGQPQYGIFSQVGQINYLDYHSHLISQKPIANWRKAFKANQFAFIQIVHAPYRICIAVATIKLASSAFGYIFNEVTGQIDVVDAIRPLSYQSQFSGDHQHGNITFTHPKLTVGMTFTPQTIDLNVNSKDFELQAKTKRGYPPLAVCTQSGRRGWTFTQKEPLKILAGKLTVKHTSSKQAELVQTDSKPLVIEFRDHTTANLDWTLGYMRHVTNWYWACINTTLLNNRQFMLNLSMGVNETGVSENACWLDDEIHYLPPVLFIRDETDTNNGLWHIKHQNLGWSNVTIDLTFKPIAVYKKTDNFGVVASIFEQWIGEYSGVIKLDSHLGQDNEKIIELDGILGLAEDHFAKW